MTPFASVPRRTIEFETATTGSWGNWGAAWGCNPQSREVVLEELRQREEEQEVCMSKNHVRLLRTAIINYKAFRGE